VCHLVVKTQLFTLTIVSAVDLSYHSQLTSVHNFTYETSVCVAVLCQLS